MKILKPLCNTSIVGWILAVIWSIWTLENLTDFQIKNMTNFNAMTLKTQKIYISKNGSNLYEELKIRWNYKES